MALEGFLRTLTAREIKIGPFVDACNGTIVQTGLTIAQANVLVQHDEGDWAQKDDTSTCVHESDGWYRCNLSIFDTNPVGILRYKIHMPGCREVSGTYIKTPDQVFNGLFSGSQPLQVDVIKWLQTAVTGATGGVPDVNVARWLTTIPLTPAVAGVPSVDPIGASGPVLVRTVISTLASQTAFTLQAGSTDNNAYVGCTIIIQDQATYAQRAVGVISAYVGSTKGVTLAANPGIFTVATGDIVTILAPVSASADPNVTTILADTTTIKSVLGALADAAADGDPTSVDTLMMYVKQLVNTLVGTAGIPTWPSSAAPANGVSLAEGIRWILDVLSNNTGTSGYLEGIILSTLVFNLQAQFDQVPVDVWDQLRDAHTAAGSFGQALQTLPNGTAQGGDATHIQLAVGASSVDNYYNGLIVMILYGTGKGQFRQIDDYVGSTRQALVSTWTTNPDATSRYAVVGV